jgi:DNA-binding MarR family transcriptional regulator
MNLPTIERSSERTEDIERLARELVPRASQLTRLVVRHTRGTISRSEGGILGTLSRGPKRITELAEIEGLAQPTTTVLVKRLEQNGWVARERDAGDGRAVLVSLTPAGSDVLDEFRSSYRAVLHERLEALSDEQIATLAAGLDAFDALLGAFQSGDPR